MNIKDLFDNFNEIKYDSTIIFQRTGKTQLYVSSIIKYCTLPYSMIINNHNQIVAIIDIKNKTLIRFTSNKNFAGICKMARLTQSKIYH